MNANGSATLQLVNLYEFDSWCVGVVVITWTLTQFVFNPLIFGIIGHNVNGILNYQSVIDKLHVYLFSIILLLNLTAFNIYCLRVFVEIPEFVCKFVELESHAILLTCGVTVSQKLTLRFLYSVVWKNVGAIDDDMFGRFFVLLNTLIGLFYAFIEFYTESYYDYTMCYCARLNPEKVITKKSIAIKATIALTLAIYCTAVLAVTHLKTRNTTFAKKVNEGFGMGTVSNIVLFTIAFASAVPRLYIHYSLSNGKLSDYLPLLLIIVVFIPYWIFTMLVPASLYFRDASLRKFAKKSLGQFRIMQKFQRLVNRNNNVVAPLEMQS